MQSFNIYNKQNCEGSTGTQQSWEPNLLFQPHVHGTQAQNNLQSFSPAESGLKKVRLRIMCETVFALHYSFIQSKQRKGFQMYTFRIKVM